MMGPMGWTERRHLLAILLAAALAGCAAATSSSPKPTATDPFLASLVPVSPAEIVFRFETNEVASFLPNLILYDDGRLLRRDREHNVLTIQRLNPAGIDAFVTEVRASGSFAASHNVPLELLPGVAAPAIDVPGDRFTLTVGGAESIIVTTSPYHDPLVFQASAEREALIALGDRVMDTSWLPADAWIDAVAEPFAPAAYLVFSGITSMPGICPPGSVSDVCKLDISTINLPFELPSDGIGPAFESADGTQSVIDHCAVVTVHIADALAALSGPQFGTAAGHLFLGLSIPWRERSATYDLEIRPLFPEEAATCAGKSLPPTIGP
jgi:hypothetical protein